jgi:hypothetical protein
MRIASSMLLGSLWNVATRAYNGLSFLIEPDRGQITARRARSQLLGHSLPSLARESAGLEVFIEQFRVAQRDGATQKGAVVAISDLWVYREPVSVDGADMIGYQVEAIDGEIGKIDEASNAVDGSFIVVDTGPWIFGKKVMLPAGVVSSVDHENKRVSVNRVKEQIKAAPELGENSEADAGYRGVLDDYYGPEGAGWRDW